MGTDQEVIACILILVITEPGGDSAFRGCLLTLQGTIALALRKPGHVAVLSRLHAIEGHIAEEVTRSGWTSASASPTSVASSPTPTPASVGIGQGN